jgi:hypothetical protein
MELDDYQLEKEPVSTAPPEEEEGSGLWMVIVAALVILAGAAVFYFWPRSATEQAQRPAARPAAASEEARRAAEPGENIVLPPLDESDEIVRELVRALSSHPTIAAWLATDGLIRNFTVVTVNIANGRTPERHLRTLAPAGAFRTQGSEANLTVDPRSYNRYDRYAEAVTAVDARGAARLYATLKPRIEEAYRELGEPEPSFDVVLERAIGELLKAPVVEGPVRLTPKPMTYAYADERLESLSPPQKHLLRMGPDNVRVIQDKLREVAGFLGIHESRLAPKT